MNFGFGHLHAVMSAVHANVDAGIVEARLKYLQRLPFPSADIKVGKGGRAYYSAEHLMKLVAAFELLAAGIVPTQAAGLVDDCWSDVAGGLARAWRTASSADASLYLFAVLDGFDSRRGLSGMVDVTPDANLANWRRSQPGAGPGVTVIDLVMTARNLEEALRPGNPRMEMLMMHQEVGRWAESHDRSLRKAV